MNDETVDMVHQWLAKAGDDWKTVQILHKSGVAPPYAICFHCQQYVEKLMKAVLTAIDSEVPKIHDLPRLALLLDPILPSLSGLLQDLVELSTYSVESRYPDDWKEISQEELAKIIDGARSTGEILTRKLDELLE